MKKICSVALAIILLLSTFTAVPVFAGSINLNFRCTGSNYSGSVTLKAVRSDGTSYVFTNGTSLSSVVTSGEVLMLFVKTPTSASNSYILYSVTDGIATKLTNNSVNGYSYTVPSEDTTLHCVVTKGIKTPVELNLSNGIANVLINSDTENDLQNVFASNGDTVTVSNVSGYTLNGGFYNALTGDLYKSGNTCTVKDFPLVYKTTVSIALSYPDKDSQSGPSSAVCGETVTVKSSKNSEFLIISANEKVIDVIPESGENTYTFTATEEYPSLALTFSYNETIKIASESDLSAFTSRVNNGEKNLNAVITQNFSVKSPVTINEFSGIFYGGNFVMDKQAETLILTNNGIVKGVFLNNQNCITETNNGLITDCFVNGGEITGVNNGIVRYCGNIATSGSIADTNNGTIAHCYSRSSIISHEGNEVENSYFVADKNTSLSGNVVTERDIYKGSVAFKLNKFEERFGQNLNADIGPVPLNSNNKIYSVKIFAGNDMKTVFVNENPNNFRLYLSKYDSDRMTDIIDTSLDSECALYASNINIGDRVLDTTVTINCSNKDITGFKAILLHNKTMSALEESFNITYNDYEYTYIVLDHTSFASHLGSWSITSDSYGGYASKIIQCNNKAEVNNPAKKTIVIPEDGFYKTFSYSKSYFAADSNVGTRFYDVQIGSSPSVTLGTNNIIDWNWQESLPVPVLQGEHELKLIDTSGVFARCGMIVITNDPAYEIDETKAGFDVLSANIYTDRDYTETIVIDPNRPYTEYAAHINGKYLTGDFSPIYREGTLYIPAEEMFRQLGHFIQTDDENGIITGTKNGGRLAFFENKDYFTIADKMHKLSVPTIVSDGIIFIPAEDVITKIGGVYKWNEATKTASIYISVFELPSTFLIRPNSFSDFGTWTYLQDEDGAFENTCLFGLTGSNPSKAKPAVAEFNVAESGEYWVWVHARDYATDRQGMRYFGVSVNDIVIDKDFGKHGTEGFAWESSPAKVKLVKGKNIVKLLDTSATFARCDAILLTQSDTAPPATLEGAEKIATQIMGGSNDTLNLFPEYTKELSAPTETYTIGNNRTRINFYKVPTSGGTVIQNEIFAVAPDNTWVKTNTRDEELGYLVLRADTVSTMIAQDNFNYHTSYKDENGITQLYQGINPYFAGESEWYVPSEITQLSENSIKITAKGKYATLTATWTLEADCHAPLVSLDITPDKEGYYSVGTWEGGKLCFEEFEQALAPYRIKEKQIKSTPTTITEQYLFTPMGTYTLYENNKYSNYPVTKGVVVDSAWIPIQWTHKEDSRFGMNMIVSGGGYKATLFYPAMGTEESKFAANQTRTIDYRVISSVSDWFENYKFIIQDLYNVDDYRQNTQTTLNEAIFNTKELIMDNKFGGWDEAALGHYNIEAYGVASEANPLQYLQDYLLTGDEEFLEERTIPTIAAFLTRASLHYNPYDYEYGSTNGYQHEYKEPDTIGDPRSGYNTNVTAGMYALTHGMVPYLYKLGLDRGKTTINAYGELPVFENTLNMYKYTGDKKYLTQAIEEADNYLKSSVYHIEERPEEWVNFIYISYFPNLSSLMDIYEATGEQRFLDAAEYAAQQILTSLWVPGVDNYKRNEKITVNNINEGFYTHYGNPAGYCSEWGGHHAGTEYFRVGRGSTKEEMEDTTSNINIQNRMQQIESWVPSRVGLGLEQSSTYYNYSSHIVMQHWVGDFMRLAHYTGEEAFETAARNAIIGRFANYSGYYQSDNVTFQQYADYPWEGPDYTGLYWHHLPPFLAMLEDFLINQAFNWSEGKIHFPAIRQQGYAYFNSNQYGHEPGKFFDEEDMWLWIDDGMIDSGNVQLDWIAARKDGVLNIAFMNECNKDIISTVKLLEKIPGGSAFNGTAKLYLPDGTVSSVNVTNGEMTIDFKAKELTAVSINLPDVKAPSYSLMDYSTNGIYSLEKTVSEHTNGKGYVLQMTPDNYFAYVYVKDKPKTAASATITYNIGNGNVTLTDTEYPYEFIIKVDNPDTSFVYTLKVTSADGVDTDRGKGELCTLAHSKKFAETGISVTDRVVANSGVHTNFTPFQLKPTRFKTPENDFLFTVNKATIPDEFESESMIGLPVTGTFTTPEGKAIKFKSYVTGIEAASTILYTVSVADTPEIRTFIYPSGNASQFSMMIEPRVSKTDAVVAYTGNHGPFVPFALEYSRHGYSGNNYRLVVNSSALPEGFRDASAKGLPVKGTINIDGKNHLFESVITNIENRGDGSYTVSIADTPEFRATKFPNSSNNSFFTLKVYDKLITTDYIGTKYSGSHGNFTPFEIKHNRYGYTDNFFRIVMNTSDLPAGFNDSTIIGLPVKGSALVPGSTDAIYFRSYVTHFETRTDGTTIVAFSDVPGVRVADVKSNAKFNIKLYPTE